MRVPVTQETGTRSPPAPPHHLPQLRCTCVIIRQIYGDSKEAGKEIQVCKPPDMVTVLRLKKEGKAIYGKKYVY